MIKVLLLTLMLFKSFILTAQIDKGTIFLGGDINLTLNSNKTININGTNRSSGLSLSPVFAKAIKNNLFLGGSLNYQLNKSTNTFDSSLKSYFIGAGIFTRKYMSLSKKFLVFLQSGLNAGWGKSDLLFNDLNYVNIFQTSVNITPGISYNISKRIYLEAGLGNIASINYLSSKQYDKRISDIVIVTNRQFSFSSSLSAFASNLYLGFRLMLPGNRNSKRQGSGI